MSKEKRSLLISIISLVLCVALFAYTTIAYFSDSKEMTNTFTAGNIKIEMSEATVKRDERGNLVENAAAPRLVGGEGVVHDYGVLYPGIQIYKDPTIKNIGTEDAWIAARVVVNDGRGDLHKVIGFDGTDTINIRELIGGGLLDESCFFGSWNGIDGVRYNDRFAFVQTAHPENGEYMFYFFIQAPLAADEKVVLFDRFNVAEDWSGEDLGELVDLTIRVEAYGVQTFDLQSSFEAMTKAFPEQFPF